MTLLRQAAALMMNELIRMLMIIFLTGGAVLSYNAHGYDKTEDFYTQYPCSCDKDDSHPGYCKKISALLKKMKLHTKLEEIKEIYENCCKKLDTLNPETKEHIKKDICRTFPGQFRDQPDQKQTFEKTLEKILMAIAVYYKELQYIQGFNYIVGHLMFHSTEHVAFGIFCDLVKKRDKLPSFYDFIFYGKISHEIQNEGMKKVLEIIGKENPELLKEINLNDQYKDALSYMVQNKIVFWYIDINFEKNGIMHIENIIDKGFRFLYCMIAADILQRYKRDMFLFDTPIPYEIANEYWGTVLSQAKIFSEEYDNTFKKCCC